MKLSSLQSILSFLSLSANHLQSDIADDKNYRDIIRDEANDVDDPVVAEKLRQLRNHITKLEQKLLKLNVLIKEVKDELESSQ
jgi:chromosome segregation ATPase